MEPRPLDMIAVVSHELRTPLNVLLGWTHILRKVEADPVHRARAIAAIDRHAQALSRLVDDLFEFSRLGAGKIDLRRRPVDLTLLTVAVVDSLRPTLSSHGPALDSKTDPDDRLLVYGDPVRLQQIIWNLVGNALRYTPPGGEITVALRRMGAWCELTVQDAGCGIEPDLLPRVFEPFNQGSASRRRGGLGLGLTIVRAFVEAHGGEVRAESEGHGRGARFTVRLPLWTEDAEGERADESAAAAAQAQLAPSDRVRRP